MCGIAGIYLKERSLPAGFSLEDFVDALLMGIESRGRHASGFVAVTADNKKMTLDKRPIAASEFVLRREQLPTSTKMVLCHTRFATQGSADVAGNNHPVVSKTAFVTHNGMINNDHTLFKEYKLPRRAQVDSEIISAMLAEFGLDEVEAIAQELSGSFAFAAIDPVENPGEIVLVRSRNPLVVLDHPKMIVWASERKAIELAWGLVIGTPPKFNKFDYPAEGDVLRIKEDTITKSRFKQKPETFYYGMGWGDHYEDDWNVNDHLSCEVPALPPGEQAPEKDEDWKRQADGSWKKVGKNGVVTVLYPTKENRYVRAEVTGETHEQCWICRQRQAVASLLEGVGERQWRVPVCIPCLREESADGEAYQEERRATRSCADCGNGPKGLETKFGWKLGKDGRTLCVLCYKSEYRIGSSMFSPGQPPDTEAEARQACGYCGSFSGHIEEDDEGVLACGTCRAIQCDACLVWYSTDVISNTWWGTLCNTCAAKEDRGAYCAECRDWFQLKELHNNGENVLRCTSCDGQRATANATETGGDMREVEDEPEEGSLRYYEQMAQKSRHLFRDLCDKVAFELNTTPDFIDWLLLVCPKSQYDHDKNLKEIYEQAQASYKHWLTKKRQEKVTK